jgi:ATP-binding cassette subfamily C protein
MAAVLEILGLGMIPVFVTIIADPEQAGKIPVLGKWIKYLGLSSPNDLIIYGGILLIITYLLKNMYLIFFLYIKQKFVENKGVELQYRLFRSYIFAPYTFYVKRNSAELLQNVENEVYRLMRGAMVPLLNIGLNAIMFISILVALLIFEPIITIISVISMGLMGFLFLKYTRDKTSDYGYQNRMAQIEKNKSIIQAFNGFKEFRILKRENSFLSRYEENAQIGKRAKIFLEIVNSLPKNIIETLAVAGILIIAFFMLWQNREVSSILPVLSLFGVAMIRLMPILNQIISHSTTLKYNAHSVHAIYDDLFALKGNYSKSLLENGNNKLTVDRFIDLKSISYRYPDNSENTIKNVSLQIKQGQIVAFVGATGAGKTTLVDIILGLLEPNTGSIYVDGVDVFKNLSAWQDDIGYIPQEIYLLDDTIRQNIAFGLPESDIDPHQIQQAMEAAQLEDFINKLKNGIETKVGENGVRLSGGERQRVGIARALYNNPDILVMDEATSSLDNRTEKYVMKAIKALKGEKTIIMIAHRLSTVKECDSIFMMQDGEVIERGSYEYLLDNCNAFREMSLAQ